MTFSLRNSLRNLFENEKSFFKGNVERMGAAQGLAEILANFDEEKLMQLLPDIVANATNVKPHIREGEKTFGVSTYIIFFFQLKNPFRIRIFLHLRTGHLRISSSNTFGGDFARGFEIFE